MKFRRVEPENEAFEVLEVIRDFQVLSLDHASFALKYVFVRLCVTKQIPDAPRWNFSHAIASLQVFPRGDLVDGQPRA